MIFHDVIAGMLYQEQKRELEFVNKKGWQFVQLFDKKPTRSAARQRVVMRCVPQTSCQTCRA